MAEPVRAIQLGIDVRFEDGKLWQPRYEQLIDYKVAPQGFQFEPAFVVRSAESGATVEVSFGVEQAEADDVEFYVDADKGLDYLELRGAPGVSVSVDGPRCQVTWKRSGSGERSLMSLRIPCRRRSRPQDGLDLVEGGVYLVMIDPGLSSQLPSGPAQVLARPEQAGVPKAGAVRLKGFDEYDRPVYDLFHGDVPRELVREPAFRAAHEEQLDFTLVLASEAWFQVDDGGVPRLSFFIPGTLRPALVGTTIDDAHKECTIQWHRPEKQPGIDTARGTTSFDILLNLADNRSVRIDPTVIEPPACDPSGVCSPPRNCC